MNRTQLQHKLKDNAITQYLYTLYIYRLAKRLLKSRAEWEKKQKQSLLNMLRYAQEHCVYYRDILGQKAIDERNVLDILCSMPLLDKQIIREERERIYSDEVKETWNMWLNTGGSTGEPMKFPALYKGVSQEAVCQMMLYMQMGYQLGDTIVSFGGNRVSEQQQKQHIFWADRGNFPYGKRKFSTLYLNSKTVEYYWNALCEVKPAFIRGYPSGILELIKLMKSRQVVKMPRLKGIYITSENFSQDEKDFISDFFHCPVYGQYGHTESSIFAVQQPTSNAYTCNPLYGYTEILDEKGQHVAEGSEGEIVVTGFIEYGLPFIRYKTGDRAVYGGKTPCGETIINELLGRSVDFIYNKQGEKIYLVGFIFGAHMPAFNHINYWQIHQKEAGKITLLIVKGLGYDQQIENDVRMLFETNGFDINIIYVDAIEKTKRGKQKFLIQETNIYETV